MDKYFVHEVKEVAVTSHLLFVARMVAMARPFTFMLSSLMCTSRVWCSKTQHFTSNVAEIPSTYMPYSPSARTEHFTYHLWRKLFFYANLTIFVVCTQFNGSLVYLMLFNGMARYLARSPKKGQMDVFSSIVYVVVVWGDIIEMRLTGIQIGIYFFSFTEEWGR